MKLKRIMLLLAASLCFFLSQAQVSYTLSYPSHVGACERYPVQLTINGLTAGQNVQIKVKNNLNSLVDEVLQDEFSVNGAYTTWDTISEGSSLVLTYYNQLQCASLENSLNDVDLDVSDSIYVNGIGQKILYQILQPKISYASGYTTISGDIAENITRNVIYKNLSAYSFNGYVELIDSLPTNVDLVNFGFLYGSVLSHQQFGNKHRFVLQVNNMDFGDSLIYKPKYSISNCAYVSGQSRLRMKLGCDTLNFCKLINTNSSLITKVVKNANIVGSVVYKTDISAPGCDIDKRWKIKVMFVNKGNRNATNVLVKLFRPSNRYTFGIIDPSTVNFTLSSTEGQITRSLVRTVQTNFCDNALSASTHITNAVIDTLGTFAMIDQMMPNDTLFVEYEIYRCCITDAVGGHNYSNIPNQLLNTFSYSASNISTGCYYIANPCNPNYVGTSVQNTDVGLSIAQYSNCTVGDVQGELSDGTTPGEEFYTSMINMDYTNTLFSVNNTSYEFWVKIDSEQGLYSEDSVYYETQDGYRWYPYSLSVIAGMADSADLEADFIHERWAKFRLSDIPFGKTVNHFMRNNAELKFKMQSYCPAKEPKTTYRVTTYIKETDCEACLMPIYENSCRVNVHCPGCLLPGTIIYSSKIRRESFGLEDLDNNRLPDASMAKATSNVLLNRVAYGDTLMSEMSINFWDAGYPFSLDNFDQNGLRLDRAYAFTRIPGASGLSVIEAKVYFNGDSITLPPIDFTANSTAPVVGRTVSTTVNSPTPTNPGNTTTVNGLEIGYDLSLQTLSALGLNMNGRVHFEGNENIRIKTRYVFQNHLGTSPSFVESEISNKAYMTGAVPVSRFAKPDDYFASYDTLTAASIPYMQPNKSFWCEDNGNFLTLVDYFLMATNYANFEPSSLSNCTRVSRIHFRCEFPTNFNDYFPYEYRNFLVVDSAKLTVPPGYEVTDFAEVTIHTNGNNPLPCASLTHEPPVQKSGNTGVITLTNSYFVNNTCPSNASKLLVPLDERNWTNLYFDFRPICNNDVADSVTGNLLEVYHHGFPNSSGYWSGQTVWSSQKTRKFKPQVASNAMTYIAGTQQFEWDNLLQIRDTARITGISGNSYWLDYHLHAPNVFVIMKSKSGRFITTSIKDASTGVITPISTNGVYQVNSLGALNNFVNLPNFKNLLVSGKYDCVGMADSLFNQPDTIVMLFGWSCNGYPADASELYAGGCFVFDSVYHTITPRDVAMDIKLRTAKNTLDFCDNTPAELVIRSTSLGYIYDAVSTLEFDRPGEMDLCSTQATARWKNQNYPITATLVASGKYQFDLGSLIGTTGLNDGDSIVIQTCFKTKCAGDGVYGVHLSTTSEAYCGDILEQDRYLNLNVLPYVPQQDDQLSVAIQVPASVTSCETSLFEVSITNTGSQATAADHSFHFMDTVIALPTLAAGEQFTTTIQYLATGSCSTSTENWTIENTDTTFCEGTACYHAYSILEGSVSFTQTYCGPNPVISGNQTVCWSTNPNEVYSTNQPGANQQVVWISSATLTPINGNTVSVSQNGGNLSLDAYFEDTLTGCISALAHFEAIEECCNLNDALTGGSCQGCDAYMTVQYDPANPACAWVTSCKNLSNVVLEDCFGNRYKFDGLSGTTGYFCMPSGNPITTVWVKSGCFKSGDGPGYGRRFDHPCVPCNKTFVSAAPVSTSDVSDDLHVYPNPFYTETHIEYVADQNGKVLIEVFDLNGKKQQLLWANNLEKGETCRVHFSPASEAASVYFVRVITASGSVIQKKVVYTP